MERIKLNKKQKAWKTIIQQIISKKLSTKQAAFEFCVTQRCIEYRVNAYKKFGDKSLIHGNTGKKHKNDKYENIKDLIIDIFNNTKINGLTFEGISYSYFTDLLLEEHNIKISVSFVKKILNTYCNYISPKKRNTKDKEIHLTRERKEREGELIQIDGSEHDWFRNNHKECLHGFIDDAKGEIISLYMTKNECSFGYHECFRNMAINKGIPMALYTDKLQVFYTIRDNKILNKPTQFGKIMDKLGVELIPANSPQAKGRVERMWGTIQGQLPFWFWLHGVTTIDEANQLLPKYIKFYNKKFAIEAKDSKHSAFVKADLEQINQYLKITTIGKVDKGGVFDLKGYRFYCRELAGKKVKICMSIHGGLWVEPEKSEKHYSVELLETDTSGPMPEVWKDLIDEYFLKNAKPKYREVYKELEFVQKGA